MPANQRAQLQAVRTFAQLVRYMRDELGWPIGGDAFDDMVFEYTPEELGINSAHAAAIQEIKRLRPLVPNQPWGIFFVKFEPKRLPVVALRRILSQVIIKKRATAKAAELAAWQMSDLLFVSNYGDQANERRISLAYFSQDEASGNLPMLKVLGWDGADTNLHLDSVAEELHSKLHWPADVADLDGWRRTWAAAFTVQHGEVITTSKRLAVRLAELARGIRAKALAALAVESEAGPLRSLLRSFQGALIHDLDAEGFADMYAQTIAYGLLTARISRPEGLIADNLADMVPVTNPFLKEMLETFVRMGGRRKAGRGSTGIDFDELGVNDVVQLLRAANMEAVVRDFGDKNPQEDPVIHFYELFLKEYDAKKRMQRGVFYTPRPVVSYIVRSVDELLRTEFGLEDGLADTATWGEMAKRHQDLKIPEGTSPNQVFVQILDPATGTGTFLVEVIDIIHKRLVSKWNAQGHSEKKVATLWNEYVPEHLLTRLHAYELLMAPYAITHLKVGLKLYETGYRFGSDERARIYLTNALEPAQDFSGTFDFAIPALAHEANAVNEVKRKQRFTVVIGNPPYSNLSTNLTPSARALVARYKQIDGKPLRERNALQLERNINDDYIKFFALSEDVLSASGSAIVSMITNSSFLDAQTLRGLRARILGNWERILVTDLGGSGDLSGSARAASGDDNVFDIQQGVAITTVLRKLKPKEKTPAIGYARVMGTRELKYAQLFCETAISLHHADTSTLSPMFLFIPGSAMHGWDEFVALTEILPAYAEGLKTGFDELLVTFTDQELRHNLEALSDDNVTSASIRERYGIGDKGWANKLLVNRGVTGLRAIEAIDAIGLVHYRPLDHRSCPIESPLVKAPSRVAGRHMRSHHSLCLLATRQVSGPSEVTHFLVSRAIPDNRCFYSKKGSATYFPVYADDSGLAGATSGSLIRESARSLYSDCLGVTFEDGRGDEELNGLSPRTLIAYWYAIFYSPTYRQRYESRLKTDFPRVPLPGSLDLFSALARLGGALVDIHLMESPELDHFITTYSGPKNSDVGRVGWSDDTVWLDAVAAKKGESAMPGTIGFRGVPEAVWNFHIGGYQVCEKWLKDRKGRTLSKDDIAHYQKIVVALNETIRLMQEIDVVIEQHGGWPGAFAQPAGNPQAQSVGAGPPVFGGARKLNLDAPSPAALQPLEDAPADPAAETSSALDGADLICSVRQLFANGVERERVAAVAALAAALGVPAADAGIAAELNGALRTAERRGILENAGGALKIGARSIEQYEREFLKEQFLASLDGVTWTEREQAIRAFARWLGFLRTGPAIDENARSLINGLIREARLESEGTRVRRVR